MFSALNPVRKDYGQELSLARLSERQDKTESAERIYHSVLKAQPDNVVANHRLGVLAAKRGLHDEAVQYFQTAEAAGLRSAEFYNDYGYLLYLQNNTSEAEQYYKKSLAVDGAYRSTHNNLGLLMGEQKQYDDSLKHFLMAVDEGEAHANLAFIQSQMGDLEASEKSYHRALEFDPDLKRAAQALVQIARKRGSVKPMENIRPNLEKQSENQIAKREPQAEVVPVSSEESVAAAAPKAVSPTPAKKVAPVSFAAVSDEVAEAAKTQAMVAQQGQATLENKVESSMTSKSGLHYPQIMSAPPSLQSNQIHRSLKSHPSASGRLGFAENTLRDTPRSR